MKSFLKWSMALSLILAVAAAIGGVLLWQEISGHPEVSISINGEDIPVHALSAAHWGSLLFAAGITLFVLAVVLPLTLLLGVALPLMIVAGVIALVLAVVAGVGALVGSPLILLVLLLWWLMRRKPPAAAAPYKPQAPGATTAPH
ncbi:hypothetical protein [Roseateles sp.]|jgi:hypothetical protein|uniref:hypothetical protein n=1 Tax=Roseateles sp. TaxID=1971397 RepID=UPI0037C79378